MTAVQLKQLRTEISGIRIDQLKEFPMQARQTISKAYKCPLTRKHVSVQLKGGPQDVGGDPELCSNIGACGCNVVEIIYGMSYTVDWKRCCLYSTIKEQCSCLENRVVN